MKKIVVISVIVLACAAIYAFLRLTTFTTLRPEYLYSQLPYRFGLSALGKSDSYLIMNVAVIPMNRDTVLRNQWVLITEGRIKQIASSLDAMDTTSSPMLIDGAGKFLIPGLNDMHVHMNDENNLLLFVANGVTTVRNMAGDPFHLKLRDKINKKEIVGPTLYTTGAILEGSNNVWDFSVVLETKKEARDTVLFYKNSGYDFIKVYHTLPKELYTEILKVADSIDIPVVGHLPFSVELEETLSLTQSSIEHVDVRPVSMKIPWKTKVQMIGKSKKWMCPTLVVHRNIQRNPGDPSIHTEYEQYVDKNTRTFWKKRLREGSSAYPIQKEMAGKIFSHGGRFLLGTDCLNSYVIAGFSIHEELEELVSAGLPEFEALRAGTVHAAEFLKRDEHIGTIEPGKIADLVLLDANPLKDITNTRRIRGVMVKGKWFDAVELESMLQAVRQSYVELDTKGDL